MKKFNLEESQGEIAAACNGQRKASKVRIRTEVIYGGTGNIGG